MATQFKLSLIHSSSKENDTKTQHSHPEYFYLECSSVSLDKYMIWDGVGNYTNLTVQLKASRQCHKAIVCGVTGKAPTKMIQGFG